MEYAYRTDYDSCGRVSVTHLVDERGYGPTLRSCPEPRPQLPAYDDYDQCAAMLHPHFASLCLDVAAASRQG